MSTQFDTFINQCIGRYQISERIGAGGMARVYKARDTSLDRTVAIKILHEHLADDVNFKQRFDREARLVARLNHPNIIQIYDYATVQLGERLVAFMVMPYIPGKTLKDVLEDFCTIGQHIPLDQVREIMLDLSAALHYAHSKGMVHRDVKPGNILFDEHNRAVLGDFGIARLAEGASLTQDGATIGTPTYLSPEQAAGMPVDGRSDLYALGVILYEMLTGRPPFSGDSAVAIILKHINEPVTPIAQIAHNPALDLLVQRALAKDPNQRYQTAQAFADDLSGALGGQQNPTMPTTLKIDTPTLILPSLKPRRRLFSGALLGIGALVLAGMFVLFAPAPTATPVISSMTEGENTYFISSFSPDDSYNTGWPQTPSGSVMREFTEAGFYRLQNNLMSTATATIHNPNLVYADGTITLEGQLDPTSNPSSGYGIIFRYQDDSNYNVFAVDGMGRYSIWELKDAHWREIRGLDERWTPGEYIKPAGELNRLTVTFSGKQIGAWVNDYAVVDLTTEMPFGAGAVGIYLASNNDGSTIALIDTYQVSDTIRSMTEDR